MSRPPWHTPDRDTFRSRVRDVLENVVLPYADQWEAQGHIDPAGWRALADEGLLGLGHHGEAFLDSAIFLEELGRTGYAGIRASIGVHAYMAASYLDLFGTPEQKTTYLEPARRGERVAALAITEAEAGSDLSRLRTRAHMTGNGYLVNGEKLYIANASQAAFFVTLVKTGEATSARGLIGASLILIDADSPRVLREPQPMLGWHSADICRVSFNDVPVTDQHILGRRDRVLGQIIRALDFERLVAGLLALGGTTFCLELLNGFVRHRRIRNAPMHASQVVRHRIAELTADHELVGQYAYHAAWLHSRGELDSRTAAIVKLKATELAVEAAHVCLQYHGAQGYLSESAAARLYRDATAGTIAAGASELLRDLI